MRIKKAGGKIFGAALTNAEQKAMDMEIRRQCEEYTRSNIDNIDAMILWHLHEEFGFGKKRLMRFYETFSERMKETSEYYLLEENKMPWLYREKLKRYGIDVAELNKRKGC